MGQPKRKVRLRFGRPVGERITPIYGKFGAPRGKKGKHNGVDFESYKKDVKASERGRVVYSAMREGSVDKNEYGNVIVIDHTPMAKKNQRHIYTLYAHLDKRFVGRGEDVKKGRVIGESGNTGLKKHYLAEKYGIRKEKQRDYHLHFELIDAPRGFDWGGGWPAALQPGHRKNPMADYIGGDEIKIEYPLSAEEMRKHRSCLVMNPHIDPKRRTWFADVFLGRKKLGRIDKFNSELKLRLTGKELDEFLKNPLRPPKGASGNMGFEIEIN